MVLLATTLRFARWSTGWVNAASLLILIACGPATGDEKKASDPQSRAIHDKLDEKISMQFPNPTPLRDVLGFVQSASQGPNDEGIPYTFDKAGMKRARKNSESLVTIESQDEPLKTSLRKMLEPLGLTYVIRKGVLTITDESRDQKKR